MRLRTIALLLSLAAACQPHKHDGHDHQEHAGEDHKEHEQGAGDDAHSEEEGTPLSITRWVDGYELFAEIDRPEPDKPQRFIVHLTKLADFSPVTDGELRIVYQQHGQTVLKLEADSVARAGIFDLSDNAPPAGQYQLLLRYRRQGKETEFSAGDVDVGKPATAPPPSRPSIPFLKEQQWRISFATAFATEQPMAHEVELPAIVEPAGSDRLTISAPTSGRFYHNAKLKLAEGLHIANGSLVGRIAPSVAGDDYSRLQFAVDDARIAHQQAKAELARIEPLVKDGLLPDKRAIAARNEITREKSRLRRARERLGRVTATGGSGGLAVRSALEGVVTEIMVANGEPVAPGQSLLRIGGENSRWVRARFVARPDEPMQDARAVAIRNAAGERLELAGRARLLSPHPTVDPNTQLATFIAEVSSDGHAEASHELRSGAHVVLLLQVGAKKPRLTVPKSAVVDINTRRYVFVQHEGEAFEKRHVVTGERDGGLIEILSGVEAGERVVTTGGYDIHLSSVMGQVESHRH